MFYLQTRASTPVGRGKPFRQGDPSLARFPSLSYLVSFRSKPLPCSRNCAVLSHDG